jgi:hypothetical protein
MTGVIGASLDPSGMLFKYGTDFPETKKHQPAAFVCTEVKKKEQYQLWSVMDQGVRMTWANSFAAAFVECHTTDDTLQFSCNKENLQGKCLQMSVCDPEAYRASKEDCHLFSPGGDAPSCTDCQTYHALSDVEVIDKSGLVVQLPDEGFNKAPWEYKTRRSKAKTHVQRPLWSNMNLKLNVGLSKWNDLATAHLKQYTQPVQAAQLEADEAEGQWREAKANYKMAVRESKQQPAQDDAHAQLRSLKEEELEKQKEFAAKAKALHQAREGLGKHSIPCTTKNKEISLALN